MDVLFNVVDMDFDVEFLGIGICDMVIMGVIFFEGVGDLYIDNFVVVNLEVYKGLGLGVFIVVDVLCVDINNIVMDMFIGVVEIGGIFIGLFVIDNLVIIDIKLVVYGY